MKMIKKHKKSVKKTKKTLTPVEFLSREIRRLARAVDRNSTKVVELAYDMKRIKNTSDEMHKACWELEQTAGKFVQLRLGEMVARTETMISQVGMVNSRVADGLEVLAQEALKNRITN